MAWRHAGMPVARSRRSHPDLKEIPMSTLSRRASLAAMIILSVASLADCATKPKYPTATAAPPPTPAAPPPAPEATPAPLPPTVSTSPSAGSVQDFVIHAGDLVYFDYNEFKVREDARAILDRQAAWLQRYPAVHVRIEGNCDERGTREYNFALGSRRANAVRDYLVAKGLSTARIETISYGKEKPIDTGADEHAWALNRNARTVITQGSR
jgi:peptidoglycan-associated lipoprotein